jgi:hypothetical protein
MMNDTNPYESPQTVEEAKKRTETLVRVPYRKTAEIMPLSSVGGLIRVAIIVVILVAALKSL